MDHPPWKAKASSGFPARNFRTTALPLSKLSFRYHQRANKWAINKLNTNKYSKVQISGHSKLPQLPHLYKAKTTHLTENTGKLQLNINYTRINYKSSTSLINYQKKIKIIGLKYHNASIYKLICIYMYKYAVIWTHLGLKEHWLWHYVSILYIKQKDWFVKLRNYPPLEIPSACYVLKIYTYFLKNIKYHIARALHCAYRRMN